MGTIICQTAFGQTLRIFRVYGEIDEGDLVSRIEHSQDGRFRNELVLWDFSAGALTFPHSAGWQGPIKPGPPPAGRRANPRTAVLAPNEIDYGLLRILLVCSSRLHYPAEVRTFRSMRAAMLWLGTCRLCPSARQPSGKPSPACRSACLFTGSLRRPA